MSHHVLPRGPSVLIATFHRAAPARRGEFVDEWRIVAGDEADGRAHPWSGRSARALRLCDVGGRRIGSVKPQSRLARISVRRSFLYSSFGQASRKSPAEQVLERQGVHQRPPLDVPTQAWQRFGEVARAVSIPVASVRCSTHYRRDWLLWKGACNTERRVPEVAECHSRCIFSDT